MGIPASAKIMSFIAARDRGAGQTLLQ